MYICRYTEMCIYVYMQIYRNADSPANSKESELEKKPTNYNS